jgi:iron complex outermembrane recepter protein
VRCTPSNICFGEIKLSREGATKFARPVFPLPTSVFLEGARGFLVKIAVLSVILASFGAAVPLSAQALSQSYQLNIPREPLDAALKDVAQQTGLQIARFSDTGAGSALVGPVSGQMTADQALRTLLEGSGLTFKQVNVTTVAVMTPEAAHVSGQSPASVQAQQSHASNAGDQEGKTSSSNGFLVAQTAVGQSQGASSVSAGSGAAAQVPVLEEVIVTARKREERLQDVPVPVTAINAQVLLQSNLLELQDYYTTVPGLSLTPSTQSSQMLAIRGITTGPGNPTVGIAIDGVPYGASTGLGGGEVVPDIDPNDLARIEVLRGPQGTLYGASSMGGLLNFVTVDPTTDRVSGRLQAGMEGTQNGAQLGYNVRGIVNVPVTDTLAIRASAFWHQDPGYIDNPVLGIDGINEQHGYGGRLAALWRPSDEISLKLSALYQEIKGDGSNDVDLQPGLYGLQQNYIPGVGAYDRKAQAYSAILNAKFGSADLTSVTAYNINSFADSFDYTSALGPLTQYGVPALGIPGFGVPGTPAFQHNKTDKFSQELRLALSFHRIDWLLGAFYTHENSPYVQDVLAEDPVTGAHVGTVISFDQPTTFSEYAAFTDFTYHFTDAFDVQVGARESHIDQTFNETDTGPFVPLFDGVPSPKVFPRGDTSNNAFTYLFTPRLKLSPDLMIYARLASGYRAGGPNQSPGGVIPAQYNPDKTQNYEIGFKGDLLDHRLTIDTSLYYIDWTDIQVQLFDPQNGLYYFSNGGRAKSEGVELSMNSHPWQGFSFSGWVVWNEAILTDDLPVSSAVAGMAGDQLPYGSRWSGNVSLQQDFPISGQLTGFAGGDVSYVGDRLGPFQPVPPRQTLPAYARTDLRAGLRFDTWTVNLFANNVTDRRGVLQGGIGYFPSFAFQYIEPRTIGVSVVKAF